MSFSQSILLYVVPVLIIALTCALPFIRRGLARRAVETGHQLELVEEYQREAARFIRLTGADQKLLHGFVVWTGMKMMHGTRLIRGIVFMPARAESEQAPAEVAAAFEAMSPEARHSFGKLGATALLISSYQSFVFGRPLRAMLTMMLSPKDDELSEPVQMVYRYKQSYAGKRAAMADC